MAERMSFPKRNVTRTVPGENYYYAAVRMRCRPIWYDEGGHPKLCLLPSPLIVRLGGQLAALPSALASRIRNIEVPQHFGCLAPFLFSPSRGL